MDSVKDAFRKVKQDIDFLNQEIINLKDEMKETRQEMLKIVNILKELTQNISKKQPLTTSLTPAHKPLNQTTPTHIPAHNLPLEPLKPQYLPISTGNEGVPTDRQTDRQTDIQQIKQPVFRSDYQKSNNSIDDAARILDSLDSLKKEIRIKFKQLTDQEILVFSALYQVEEEQGPVDYKTLATKLNLTESSIRDYIGRLIKKGIPLDKKRINNKQIVISVSPNLKKIATLPTILQLRDI
jgi:DNA-binding MarR family transcriptional regulator